MAETEEKLDPRIVQARGYMRRVPTAADIAVAQEKKRQEADDYARENGYVNEKTGQTVKGWIKADGSVSMNPQDGGFNAIPIWDDAPKFDEAKKPENWDQLDRGGWNEGNFLAAYYSPLRYEGVWDIGRRNEELDLAGTERESGYGDYRTATLEDWKSGKFADSWQEYTPILGEDKEPIVRDGKVLLQDTRTRGGSGLFGVVDDIGSAVGLGDKPLTKNLGRDFYGATDLFYDFMPMGGIEQFYGGGLFMYGPKGKAKAQEAHADWGMKDYNKTHETVRDVGAAVAGVIASVYGGPWAGAGVAAARTVGRAAYAETYGQDPRWANVAGDILLSAALAYAGGAVGAGIRNIASPAVQSAARIGWQSASGAISSGARGNSSDYGRGALTGAVSGTVGEVAPNNNWGVAAEVGTSYGMSRLQGQDELSSALNASLSGVSRLGNNQKGKSQLEALSKSKDPRAKDILAYLNAGRGLFGAYQQQKLYNSKPAVKAYVQQQAKGNVEAWLRKNVPGYAKSEKATPAWRRSDVPASVQAVYNRQQQR